MSPVHLISAATTSQATIKYVSSYVSSSFLACTTRNV